MILGKQLDEVVETRLTQCNLKDATCNIVELQVTYASKDQNYYYIVRASNLTNQESSGK